MSFDLQAELRQKTEREIAQDLAQKNGYDYSVLRKYRTDAEINQAFLGVDPETYEDAITRDFNERNEGDIQRGIRRGTHSVIGSFGGMAALGGSLMKKAGFEESGQAVQDAGMNVFRDQERKASLYPKDKWSDSKIGYIVGTASELIPTMAEAATTAIVTGGGFALGKTILTRGLEETAKKVAVKQAVKTGMKVGVGAGVFPMETGGMYGDLKDKYGVDAPFSASFFGSLSTAMEYIPGGNIAIIDKMFKASSEGKGRIVKAIAKELLESMPSEAVQEAGQETMSVLNTVANTDEKFLTRDHMAQIGESAFGGAIGGAMGTPVKIGVDAVHGEFKNKPSTEGDQNDNTTSEPGDQGGAFSPFTHPDTAANPVPYSAQEAPSGYPPTNPFASSGRSIRTELEQVKDKSWGNLNRINASPSRNVEPSEAKSVEPEQAQPEPAPAQTPVQVQPSAEAVKPQMTPEELNRESNQAHIEMQDDVDRINEVIDNSDDPFLNPERHEKRVKKEIGDHYREKAQKVFDSRYKGKDPKELRASLDVLASTNEFREKLLSDNDALETRAKQVGLSPKTLKETAELGLNEDGPLVDLIREHLKGVDGAKEPAGLVAGDKKSGETQVRKNEVKASDSKTEMVHDHTNTQVDILGPEAYEMRSFSNKIPDSELYTKSDDDSYGRDDSPHITVKYGLETNDPDDVRKIIENHPPIKAKMGKVSIFENGKYDVVKVDIESPELHSLNKQIEENAKISLPSDHTFEYSPHATIAYVTPGDGKKYVGDRTFEGKEITFDELTVSTRDGKLHKIKFNGKPVSEEMAQEQVVAEDAVKIEPKQSVSWKNKSGEKLSGTVIKKTGKYWLIQKDGGGKTLVAEKDLGIYGKDRSETEAEPAGGEAVDISDKSKGHVGFFNRPGSDEKVEVYKDSNGDVYTAPVSSVIDVDTGYRIGRFEAPAHLADQAINNLLGEEINAAPVEEQPNKSIEDFGEKIGGARKDTSSPIGRRGTVKEEKETGWRSRYQVSQIQHETVRKNGEYVDSDRNGKWGVWDKRKKESRWGVPQPVGGKVFDTMEEAEEMRPVLAVAEKHRPYPVGEGKYSIFRNVSDRKRIRVVKEGFESRDAAKEYMVKNADEILSSKLSFGEEVLPKPEQVYRYGKERRKGDIAPDAFSNVFGFRGVEFGNWVSKTEERQEVMNHAYDALLDMAEVLNIPPKAVSLNGELALAFGARGQGLSGAAAHYEPAYAVINLTKMAGAGHLAHEWFHAFDHYIGRLDGKAETEKIENSRGDYVYKRQDDKMTFATHGFQYARSGARKELREAYGDFVRSMLTKGEQYVEDTMRVERFLSRARDELKSRLDSIRNGLAKQLDKRFWKRKNAPATPEQLSRFDKLSDMLLTGEMLNIEPQEVESGRGLKVRHTNAVLNEMSEIYQAVRGRSGFSDTGDNTIGKLRFPIAAYRDRIKTFKEAEEGKKKTKTIPTSFMLKAREADQARSKDYWSTPHELAARAFAAYVEDRLDDKSAKNDFLAYHAHGAVLAPVYPEGLFMPYPEGKERTAINEAFDKLFETIKTKKTDKGVALYSTTDDLKSTREGDNKNSVTSQKGKGDISTGQTPAPDGGVFKDTLGQLEPKASISLFGSSYGDINSKSYFAFHSISNAKNIYDRWGFDIPDGSTHKSRNEIVNKKALELKKEFEKDGWTVVMGKDGYNSPELDLTHNQTQKAKNEIDENRRSEWDKGVDVFVRYGDLPDGGKSYDRASQKYEKGVSVFRGRLLPDGEILVRPDNHVDTATFHVLSASNRPIYVIEGKEIGLGADGEPVLANAKQTTPKKAAKKYFKDSINPNQARSQTGGKYLSADGSLKNQPTTFYHGTQHNKLFGEGAPSSRVNSMFGETESNKLYWFTDDPKQAVRYANGNAVMSQQRFLYPGGKVHEAHLSAKNPRIVDMNNVALTPEEKEWTFSFDDGSKATEIGFRKEQEVRIAKRNGNDSIVFLNAVDGSMTNKGTIIGIIDHNNIKIKNTVQSDKTFEPYPKPPSAPRGGAQYSLDRSPGQGVTIQDIQSRFKNQEVFLSQDGTISVRMENGIGLQIIQAKEIGGQDIKLAMKTGRMGKNGKILGKYQDRTITLSQDLAGNFTRDHELYHFLKDVGVISKGEALALIGEMKRIQKKGGLTFNVSSIMEENEANTFAQVLADRETERGTLLGRLIQKVMDFIDALRYAGRVSVRKLAGRVSVRKLAGEVESGTIFGKNAVMLPVYDSSSQGVFKNGKSSEISDAKFPHVELRQTGEIQVPNKGKIRNAGEIAGILSSLSDAAQEEAWGIAIDKSGRIIEVHKFSKGLADEAPGHINQMTGHLLKNKSVHTVYLVHNHPGGTVFPSPADRFTLKRVDASLRLNNIKTKGIVISDRNYIEFDKRDVDIPAEIPTIRKDSSVPVSERRIVDRSPQPDFVINEKDPLTQMMRFDGKEDGVLLADGGGQEVVFIPYERGKTIRQAAIDILSKAAKHNATYAVINVKTLDKTNRWKFYGRLAEGLNTQGIEVLDFITEHPATGPMSLVEANKMYKPKLQGMKALDDDEVLYQTSEDFVYGKAEDTYFQQAIDFVTGAIKHRKDKGQGYREDISTLESIFKTTMYNAEKIGGAAKRAFNVFRKQPDWKFEKQRELLFNGDESLQSRIENYRKKDKSGYQQLNEYIVNQDVMGRGHIVRDEGDAFALYHWKKEGGAKKRLGIFESEEETWEYSREVEAQESGLNEMGQDALKAARLITRKMYLHYAQDMKAAIEAYKAANLPMPEITTVRNGKEVQIDLETLSKELGDRQGYYFPRLRQSGEWKVDGKKKGRREHQYFDSKIMANKYRAKLERDGFKATLTQVGKLSEDIYQALEPLLSLQQTINKTLREMSNKDKERVLEDRNLSTEWRKDTLVLKGRGIGIDVEEVLSPLGGRYIDHFEKTARGEKYSPEIHFENVDPSEVDALEERILKAVLYSGHLFKDMDVEFATAFAKQFDAILKGRGSRARMIARTDARGEDVSRGYEEDLVTALVQAANAAAGGYAKGQVAQQATAAIMGRDISWQEFQERHGGGIIPGLEKELADLELSSPEELEQKRLYREDLRKLRGTLFHRKFISLEEVEDIQKRAATLQKKIDSITKYKDEELAKKIQARLNEARTGLYEQYQQMTRERSLQADKQGKIYRDVTATLKDILRNDEATDRFIGMVKAAAVFKYLGFRVSSALINVTNMITGVPAVMNGETDDRVSIASALKHVAVGIKEYSLSRRGRSKHQNLFDEIAKKGWDEPKFNREAFSALQGRLGRGWSMALETSMFMFGVTEKMNRAATIAGTYLAMKEANKGKLWDHDAMMEKAKDISDKAHGVYEKSNRPYHMRGQNIGARTLQMAYVFQTFQHNYIQEMVRLGFDKKQTKAMFYMLFSPAIFGVGATLPVGLTKLIAKLLDWDDPEEKFIQVMDDNFGSSAGNFARYGITGIGDHGVSLKGSLAFRFGVPGKFEEIFGAPGSVVSDIWDGGTNIVKGHYQEGFEKLAPAALGNVSRGIRESASGVTTRSGSPVFFGNKPLKGDTIDTVLRVLSFNPTNVAKKRDVQWNEYQVQTRFKNRKAEIYKRLRVFYDRPPGRRNRHDRMMIEADIRDFNNEVRSKGISRYVPLITRRSIKSAISKKPPKRERMRQG